MEFDLEKFKKSHALGSVVKKTDLRDYTYNMVTTAKRKKSDRPDKFVLSYPYKILNQGAVGSCVSHACAMLKSFIDGRPINDIYSVGFLHAYRPDDSYCQSQGMYPSDPLRTVTKVGDVLFTDFPYNEHYPSIKKRLDEKGLDSLLDKANQYKSQAYIRLEENEIKDFLYEQGKPIMVQVLVYDNFYDSLENKGVIPPEHDGKLCGSHEMLIIGYDGDMLIIVNSWGNQGDNGLFYLDLEKQNIIRSLYSLVDEKQIIKPNKITYTIGWNLINGKWAYSNDGTTLLSNKWIRPNGTDWYYIGEDSFAYENKWLQYKGDWYFLKDDSCAMAHNEWVYWKGIWYWMLDSGVMATSQWISYKNKKYYVDAEGHMLTGTQNINGVFYEFDVKEGHLIKEYPKHN